MSEAWTSWPAPAKLNLFLHITGRRRDGYHLLQTCFQLLDWGDTVHLQIRQDGHIASTGDVAGVAVEDDLCLRAALALRERSRTGTGVDIRLDKRLPIGGGLGGGSSDAATTLIALNELWGLRLAEDELAEIGLQLGADVPLFVRARSAWAEGIGERLTPLERPPQAFVIVDPRVHVATAPLFQATELTRNCEPTTITDFLAGTVTSNVFAPLVRARYPRVAEALDWLGRFGDARLTGSGGCGFVAVDSPARASDIVKSCPPEFAAHAATGVNRSPLLDALQRHRSLRVDSGVGSAIESRA